MTRSYEPEAIAKGIADLIYTAAVLGVVAYAVRGELRDALARKRADFDERRAAVEAETDRIHKGRDYLAAIGPRIIAEEGLVRIDDETGAYLGMEP